jgi:hypothetical protein
VLKSIVDGKSTLLRYDGKDHGAKPDS